MDRRLTCRRAIRPQLKREALAGRAEAEEPSDLVPILRRRSALVALEIFLVCAGVYTADLWLYHAWASGGPPTPNPKWHWMWSVRFFWIMCTCFAGAGAVGWRLRKTRVAD